MKRIPTFVKNNILVDETIDMDGLLVCDNGISFTGCVLNQLQAKYVHTTRIGLSKSALKFSVSVNTRGRITKQKIQKHLNSH